MIFTNNYFVGDLLKGPLQNENIFFQPTKSKYICAKVGNFED